MKPKTPKGEMPFLDHLEELRWRILWSLAALIVGSVIGFYLLQRFHLFDLLTAPVLPYLPDGHLYVTRPTDPFIITLKLSVATGLVFASPVIFAQLWKFLAPALYEHEKRYIIPALIAGFGLFLAGVLMAYLWVLPAVFAILHKFGVRLGDLQFIITANEYIGFAIQVILAFGIMFQLPVVMTMMSAMGLIRPESFARNRPIALVFASIFAALLTPPDVFSMMMMMAPLLLLYELGIFVSRILVRRQARNTIGTAVILAILLLGTPGEGSAQEPPPQRTRPPPATVTQDTAQARQDSVLQPIDTAAARTLGLPTAPSRQFPTADSVIQRLMELSGYAVTRYAGDSITLFGETREIVLVGSAMVEREGSTLEAGLVSFKESDCRLLASGEPEPVLFDKGSVLVGKNMRYDTCERRGTVPSALTSFEQSGVTWYLRGGLEVDSASTRIYGEGNEITSCDHPSPHYHITAGNVKWVSNTIMVARPAVLYVRDVPILWLPFIYQDVRPGRRSGMLVPRFGFNDLVRPNSDYRRHISNIGYYFAINDYVGFQASLDWFAGNYIGLNGQLQYRWLNQFLQGGVSASWIFEETAEDFAGDRSMRLQWNHNQSFSQRTRLTASVDYATSARVVKNNSVDPFLQTATLSSRVNFNKQFSWGTFSLGGSYTQDLSNEQVTQSLPTISLTPAPIALWSDATWSPSFSLSNQQLLNQRTSVTIPLPPEGGVMLLDTLKVDTRTTNMSFRTPLRVGRWNWNNDISVIDFRTSRPPQTLIYADPENPADTITRYFSEDFRTEIDWNTGINLPILFGSTWKLQPSIGIRNTTGGAFLLRNQFTGGEFVTQGKRFSLNASMGPTFFGFFPGVGPLSRIRHSFAPILSWSFAPKAEVPEAYARALDPTGSRSTRESPTVHRISIGFSNTFEGKLKAEPGDTTTDPRELPKVKLLSIQTSAFEYDFEQAKLEGRTGWVTSRMTNRFSSELLPGFSLSTTHDLWDGPVGTEGSKFKPFLTSVSMRFSLSGSTFQSLLGLVTGQGDVPRAAPQGPVQDTETIGLQDPVAPMGSGLGQSSRLDRPLDQSLAPRSGGRGLQAAITYDDQRSRPTTGAGGELTESTTNRTLGFAVSFSPTPNWSVSWNTQYNLTLGQFGQHVVRLDRNLHRWRATFAFLKAPNGNFAFNFFIALTDQPELKMQYDQRTVR